MRTNVYVDGLNLYYGAVRGTAHKWLNIENLFSKLRPADSIQAIYYFTALIDGPHRQNQEAYLKALETLPTVTTILGRFKSKRVKCKVPYCTYAGSRVFWTDEEKRTDVHIALMMAADAWEKACEQMVLVSGDSDLVPAITLVKMANPSLRVIVYVPARHPMRGAAVELRSAADKARILPNNLLPICQFPATLDGGAGSIISKPATW